MIMMMMRYQDGTKLVPALRKVGNDRFGIARIDDDDVAVSAQGPDVVIGKSAQSDDFHCLSSSL